MSTPEQKLPTSTLLDLLKWGKMRTHHFQETLCKPRLEHDFGVDISTLKPGEYKSKLRWYQEDYKLFLARIETSDESADELTNALFLKNNPPLINGNKDIELLEKIRKKLVQERITGRTRRQIDAALFSIAIYKNDMAMMDEILERYPTSEKKKSLLMKTIIVRYHLVVVFGGLLHFAAQLGKPDAIKKILSQFVTPEEKKAACLNKNKLFGITPLHAVAKSKNPDAIKELLAPFQTNEEKIKACQQKSGSLQTPLDLAYESGNLQTFLDLIPGLSRPEQQVLGVAILNEKETGCLTENNADTTLTPHILDDAAGEALATENLDVFATALRAFTIDQTIEAHSPLERKILRAIDIATCNGKTEYVEFFLEFYLARFSLEFVSTRLLGFLSGLDNLATQKNFTNKIINRLEEQSENDRRQYLGTPLRGTPPLLGNALLMTCKQCGNTQGFNIVTGWLQPVPAATLTN